MPVLDSRNHGCHTLHSEAACVAAEDGRSDARYAHQPCRWCCGHQCTENGNRCEPETWLFNQNSHVGRSKNGLGEGTCMLPLDNRFHCYSDTNAYEGFGSSNDIDDDAASLKGVSMSTCQQHCRDLYECLCVVYYKCPSWGCEHGHVDGQCWRRASCTFSRAKHNDPGFEMCEINKGRL